MKRVLVRRALVPALVFALGFTTACQERTGEAAPEEAVAEDQASSFVLKGTVLDVDDSPAVGVYIRAYKADSSIPPGVVSLEVGPGGTLLNPSGKTDEEGHFQIEVPWSFLPEGGEFKLTTQWGLQDESLVTDDKNIVVVLKASPGLDLLDLDQLVGSIRLRM